MTSTPLISFIIVNYRAADKVERAVRSIGEYCTSSHEIIVVDNSDATPHRLDLANRLRPLPAQLIDPGRNGGFGAGCNVGAQHASGNYLFFLNPDAALVEDCATAMAATLAKDSTLGAMGCKVINENSKVENSFGEFITIKRPLQWAKHVLHGCVRRLTGTQSAPPPTKPIPQQGLFETQYVTGAALMMPSTVFSKLNGFDESFFMYAEETDLQYRMTKQLALRTMVDLGVKVFHENGGTFTIKNHRRCLLERGCYIFIKKHHSFLYTKSYKLLALAAASIEVLASPVFSDYSAKENAKLFTEILKF
ncbi:glycosyltransferase family 2 protein [Aquabacterium sp.]|uniref:glycosyltransferase family 2 protein n=1 Tax=Aquabacterium sp. TaxID=1872578 RepID=UPI00199AE9DB|nr:glycosyltransferase family 2 protein [Aquabacterium sp.]MBC7700163.1 glycosyltransferase family 2 protein [Aquabacterium sp.]